jgi:hypothetical protein
MFAHLTRGDYRTRTGLLRMGFFLFPRGRGGMQEREQTDRVHLVLDPQLAIAERGMADWSILMPRQVSLILVIL